MQHCGVRIGSPAVENHRRKSFSSPRKKSLQEELPTRQKAVFTLKPERRRPLPRSGIRCPHPVSEIHLCETAGDGLYPLPIPARGRFRSREGRVFAASKKGCSVPLCTQPVPRRKDASLPFPPAPTVKNSRTIKPFQALRAKWSMALAKAAMVASASPCSIPSRTQCCKWPSSTICPTLCSAPFAALI